MQKLILLFAVAAFSLALNAQNVTSTQNKEADQPNETAFFMGANAGWDFDINAYNLATYTQPDKSYYSYFDIKPRYNIGFDMGLKVSKKLRPRVELKFVNVKYGISYGPTYINGDGTHMGDNEVNLNYFDLTFHMDYLLFTKSKLQLYVSPAIKYEYQVGSGFSGNKYNFLDLSHPTSIAGGAVSAILKYNLTKHWGFTLTPEYTYFFRHFVLSNSKPYERFSSNLGFEYKF